MSVKSEPNSDSAAANNLTSLLSQLLLGMLRDFADAENLSVLNLRKEWLLGSKQSIADAVIALQSLELKRVEISAKCKSGEVPTSLMKIGKDDARIIDAFLNNFAEHQRAKPSAQQKQKNDSKRASIAERDIAPGL